MHEALTTKGGGCRAFLMVCHVTWEERLTFCVARHSTPATVPHSAVVQRVGFLVTGGRTDVLWRLHPTDPPGLGFWHELGRVLADIRARAFDLHTLSKLKVIGMLPETDIGMLPEPEILLEVSTRVRAE